MKLSQQRKKTRTEHHAEHLDSVLAEPNPVFLVHMCKAAGVERKDFQYGLRVSKQLVKGWFDGTRHDPLTRTKHIFRFFREKQRSDLIVSMMIYCAGGYDGEFEGAVLTATQVEALKELAKVVSDK